jgi:hypothetical protein
MVQISDVEAHPATCLAKGEPCAVSPISVSVMDLVPSGENRDHGGSREPAAEWVVAGGAPPPDRGVLTPDRHVRETDSEADVGGQHSLPCQQGASHVLDIGCVRYPVIATPRDELVCPELRQQEETGAAELEVRDEIDTTTLAEMVRRVQTGAPASVPQVKKNNVGVLKEAHYRRVEASVTRVAKAE